MSRRYLFAGLGVLALAAALAIPTFAQPRTGPGGPGGGGHAPGMMGPGHGPGYGWNTPAGGPVNIDGAADRVRDILLARGYTDLVVEEVMEFSNHFYVLVKEKSTGLGASEWIIERNGFLHPEPGPNMMWNTKYGHMGGAGGWGIMGRGMMGSGYGPGPQGSSPTVQPSVTLERAGQVATQYLSTALPGATPDHGTAFYGYFTFDVERDGKTVGMLSVNAYTGQVWYHNWHDEFVQEKEF